MKCLLLHGNTAAKEDEIYELPQSLVERWFTSGRYARMGTIGDGSCFYHSVCRSMDTHGYGSKSHQERRAIAKALRTALSGMYTVEDHNDIKDSLVGNSKKSFQQIKDMMLDPKTWAEETMIRWASKALQLNVVFLNLGNNANTVYCGIHDSSTAELVKQNKKANVPTVVVAWIDNSHFELVVRIDAVEDDRVVVTTRFDPSNAHDAETIKNLMHNYTKKCGI
jgi:hypothetical protein